MRFKETARCDVCGKPIRLPKEGVIEWGSFMIRLCHAECSTGYRHPEVVRSSMELESPIFTADVVNQRLLELEETGHGDAAKSIRHELFSSEE